MKNNLVGINNIRLINVLKRFNFLYILKYSDIMWNIKYNLGKTKGGKIMSRTLNLFIPCNIGEINNKKVTALNSVFGTKYKNGVLVNNQQLVMSDSKTTINIVPNQISYSTIDPDFKTISDDLVNIFNTLLIDENIQKLTFQQFETFEKPGYMESTKTSYYSYVPGVIGIGLRSFFNFENTLCEFKVEPYLANGDLVFFECIYTLTNININLILNRFNLVYNDYIDKYSHVFEKLNN